MLMLKGRTVNRSYKYECELLQQERARLKAAVLQTENWPTRKDTLIKGEQLILKDNIIINKVSDTCYEQSK